MKRIIAAVLLGILLSSCQLGEHYRYPCQDPAKWETQDCKPPICEASGTCTKDLTGVTTP